MGENGGDYESKFWRVLCGILRVTCNREERDQEIILVQRKLRGKLLDLESRLKQKRELPDIDSVQEELGVLEETFYIKYPANDSMSEPKARVFGEMIPTLADYITKVYGRRIDHGHYNLAVNGSSYFEQLDAKYSRSDLDWILNTDSGDKITVRPLQSLDELYAFMDPDNRICFFDLDRNLTQLYLYAAHQQSRMLGMWDASGKPKALIPMLMMNMNGHLPVLSVEFPLLVEENFTHQRFKTRQDEETSLSEVLLDLVLVYSLLQVEKPLPVIGSCRRNDDNSSYKDSFRNSVVAAARGFDPPWYFIFRNKVGTQQVDNTQRDKPRKCTTVRFDEEVRVELPEDQRLLAELHSKRYRFNTVLMHSQDFLDDKERNKTVLYGDWGAMKGTTHIIPIKEYFRIRAEQGG